mmetsp:Transcript_67305/g.152271  ORF Transcript_67305/g.152271 Transcript_67305/m.152271 type:complete len:205 (-) Transcript_67305:403-1017(-)
MLPRLFTGILIWMGRVRFLTGRASGGAPESTASARVTCIESAVMSVLSSRLEAPRWGLSAMTCALVPTTSPSLMFTAPLKLAGKLKLEFPAAMAAPSVSAMSSLDALTSKPGHAVSVGAIPENFPTVVPPARLFIPEERAALLLEEFELPGPKSVSEDRRVAIVLHAASEAAGKTAICFPSAEGLPTVPTLRANKPSCEAGSRR